MGAGGGGSQSSKTTTEPWSAQQPYLEQGFQEAENLYNQGPATYYPGNTYVDMADATQEGLAGQVAQANQGAGVSQAASDYATNVLSGNSGNPYANILGTGVQGMTDTASGAFLNNNPYLDATYDQAASRMAQTFNDSVMPGVASQFGAAGGAGSELHKELATKTAGEFTDSLASLSSSIYGGNYQQERDRMTGAQSGLTGTGANLYNTGVQQQQGAAGMASGLQDALYTPYDRLKEAGGAYEQFGEKVLEDDINRFNYGQNADLSALQDYMSMISGNYGSTSTSRSSGSGGSGLSTGLGAISTIASLF